MHQFLEISEKKFQILSGLITVFQYFFKFQRTAEKIQCTAHCHIQTVLSIPAQPLQILIASHASGIGNRASLILCKNSRQLLVNSRRFPLHVHRMYQELCTVFSQFIQQSRIHFDIGKFLPPVCDNIIVPVLFPAA